MRALRLIALAAAAAAALSSDASAAAPSIVLPIDHSARLNVSGSAASVVVGVDLALETFEHVEHTSKARLGRDLGGQSRALATAAQQQHVLVLADLLLKFANEARIARERGTAGPGHMQCVRHMADELALFRRAHIDQHCST